MARTLARVGTRGMQLAARKMAGANPYFRAGSYAYRYGPDAIRAGARIAQWAMRRNRRNKRMNNARSRGYGAEPKAQGVSRAAATSLTGGVLYVSNLCESINLGTAPDERKRQWADVVGLKLRLIGRNTQTAAQSTIMLHVAIIARQGIGVSTIGNGFFTDPTPGAGYQGIDFPTAQAADKSNVNILDIHKGRYKVYMHKRVIVEPTNSNYGNINKTDARYGTNSTYQNWWVPIKKKIFFDPDDAVNTVQNPIYLCLWCESIATNISLTAPAIELKEYGKLYFKHQ